MTTTVIVGLWLFIMLAIGLPASKEKITKVSETIYTVKVETVDD